jgi:Zn-dependent protease with chaperone function
VEIPAVYYDGQTARRYPISLVIEQGIVSLYGPDFERHERVIDIEVPEHFGAGARVLRFADGAYCEVTDHAALNTMLAASGYRAGALERWQRSGRVAIAALVGVVVVSVLAYYVGLPAAADVVARKVPMPFVASLSQGALAALDESSLNASTLDAERRAALVRGYSALKLGDTQTAPRIEFRASPTLGANAFALPDGTVVLLDELVEIAGSDDEIYAVLAHEQGHVHYRHGLRRLLQGSVVATAMTAWLGDVSSLLVLLPTVLLETRYSRRFETEADDYAADQLRARGLSPGLLADALEHLAAHHHGGPDIPDYLSSHPATAERIKKLRAAAE